MTNEQFRIEWVSKMLKKQKKGLKIIDVGAGECRYRKNCGHLRYLSQDFNQYNPKKNKKGLQMESWNNTSIDIVSDICSIPVKSNTFDVVLCTEVLEHLPHPDNAIKEISRILKKGGKLILTTPFCSLTHFAPFHFCTGFSRYYLKSILEENNLKINEISSNGNYFSYIQQEIFRIPYVIREYQNKTLGLIIWPLFKLIGIMMTPLVVRGNKTKDLCCFGYHVIASKR